MPIHIFKILFPRVMKEQLVVAKIEALFQYAQQNYNYTIRHMKVKIGHNNKPKNM